MLHENSNNNLVENNTVSGNLDGIVVYQSSNNTIRNNTISKNQRGVRINKASMDNLFEGNQIEDNMAFTFMMVLITILF